MNDSHYFTVKGLIQRDLKMAYPADYYGLAGGKEEYLDRLRLEVDGFSRIYDAGVKEIEEIREQKDYLKNVFNKIVKLLDKYLDIEKSHTQTMAIWIIGTYFHSEFETFPYLFLNAMRGSGKTRALKLITKMAWDGKILISLTEAALFRSTGTLGIDEFEGLASKGKQSLRELLNAGYKKGINVTRMKKQKSINGEEIVPETFECYRPITMANIWGMEEVLGDRCISLILEKSNNPLYTKLIEDFEDNRQINEVLLLLKSDKCRLCRVVTEKNIYNSTNWNSFITSLYTLTTQTTQTTQTTSPQDRVFKKIHDTNIDGRNLELYFPLFLIANEISEEVFDNMLEIASETVKMRKIDEISESKDVTMYTFVAGQQEKKYYKIKDLVNTFKLVLGDGDGNIDWLNTKWMGRALKRLNLVIDKRRVSEGREVTLNVEKANDKLEMFK